MHLVAHPMALHYARTARDGDDVGRARGRRHLLARDLIDAVIHDHDGQVARPHHAYGGEATQRHEDRAVALERNHSALGLRDCDAEGNRTGKPHAAQHVEVLRPMPGGIEIEIGVADPGHDRLFARELRYQPLGQLGAIEDLHARRIDGRSSHAGILLVQFGGAAGLPPVSSGERMKTTGLWVVNACLMDLSRTTDMVLSSVRVWCATAMESSVGRSVRATVT